MKLPRLERRRAAVLPLAIGLFAGCMVCTCGHLSWVEAAVIAPCAAALWLWTQHGSFPLRALVAALPVLLLGKAVTDTLWDGHEPWLVRTERPGYLLVEQRVAARLTLLLAYVGSAAALRWTRRQRADGPDSIGFDGSAPHSNQPGS